MNNDIITTENYVFFLKGPFSQWYKSPFVKDGVTYSCAEQFMMAEKAKLFGDVETFKQIMATSSPKTMQDLGRKVSNYSQEKWDANKMAIVFEGNLLKFTQNSELKSELLKTDKKILVEANPDDRVWGVGLDMNNPKILNEENWKGNNLLGSILEFVRSALVLY